MYIDSLDITNLRCFQSASLGFQHPDRQGANTPDLKNINLLLGNNGSGKTTILRAIALATLSPVIDGGGYVPYSMIRRIGTHSAGKAEMKARIVLHQQDVSESEGELPGLEDVASTSIERIGTIEKLHAPAILDRRWEKMFDSDAPAFLVVGYGASRRVESSATYDSSLRSKSRLLRYQRVAGLFEEAVTLTPLEAWLPELEKSNRGRFTQVSNLLNRLLPEETRFEGKLEGGEYLFRRYHSIVPFGALSDGYRAFIGWVADLLYHVCMGCPKGARLAENRGIVLVDEVDLHLHPEWQRTVVPTLAKTFPKLQFVLTTHSPIVTGTLQSQNIHVMGIDEETGASTVCQLEEDIHGLNADQVLLSSYFGLPSSRDPRVVNELRELSRRARSGDPDAALDFLRALSTGAKTRQETVDGASSSARTTRKRKRRTSTRAPHSRGE